VFTSIVRTKQAEVHLIALLIYVVKAVENPVPLQRFKLLLVLYSRLVELSPVFFGAYSSADLVSDFGGLDAVSFMHFNMPRDELFAVLVDVILVVLDSKSVEEFSLSYVKSGFRVCVYVYLRQSVYDRVRSQDEAL
jgi:hypothetical protein